MSSFESTPHEIAGWKVCRVRQGSSSSSSLCTVTVTSTLDPSVTYNHPPQEVVKGITTRHDCGIERWTQLNERIRYRPDDVLVVSYPKSGTTWLEQLCLLLLAKGDLTQLVGAANKNTYSPKTVPLRGKIWPEACIEQDPKSEAQGAEFASISWTEFDDAPSPRVIKSHAPTELILGMCEPLPLPRGTKLIIVSRNPLDACCSRFYHAFNPSKLGWDFAAWAAVWLSGNTTYGDWFSWVRDWWARARAHPDQILWVQYEDMKADPVKEATRASKFLCGGDDPDPLWLQRVVELSSFGDMKDQARRQGGDNHLRKGVVGDWEAHFTEDMVREFMQKYQQELRGTGLQYDFGGSIGVVSAASDSSDAR